jgi:ATP-binding cassette subfamily B protein
MQHVTEESDHKAPSWSLMRRFAGYYRPYGKLFTLDMACSLMQVAFALTIPYCARAMFRQAETDKNIHAIVLWVAATFVVVGLWALMQYITTRWGHYMGARIETDMRTDLFNHLQKLSYSYYDRSKTGRLLSRMANDLFAIAEMAHHVPENILVASLMMIGALTLMFIFSPMLALVALVAQALMVLYALGIGRGLRKSFLDVRRKIADITSHVENSIQGVREVKSFANEDFASGSFDEVNVRFKDAKANMYRKMAVFHSGMMFMTESCQRAVVGGGAILAAMGKIAFSDVIAFMGYSHFAMMPIRRLTELYEQLQQGSASLERFAEIMDVAPEIVDPPHPARLEKVVGNVELRNVCFRYDSTPDWVLDDVSLDIPAGSTVALVGESGAGKSTLAALLPRFYEAQQGTIRIDGVDVRDMAQRELRRNIGIVRQNVFMFDTTIRENIMFGRPDAGEEEMVEAARRANILDFIESLPDGFDTVVGEQGVRLSGGQKQRLSIARVFLKNPPILIFDEATSSLDNESEQRIRQSIEDLSEDRTCLVIAHRLSTVRSADHTYVMRKGRIVEDGHHSQLVAGGGYFSELYRQGL